MTLEILGHSYAYHIEHIIRIFYPYEIIEPLNKGEELSPPYVVSQLWDTPKGYLLKAEVEFPDYSGSLTNELALTATPEEQKRELSRLVFLLLREQSGFSPPWGMLMGVRPLRLLRRLLEEQGEEQGIASFQENYYVSPDKTKLALETMNSQKNILLATHDKAFSLYISIPFCPTRCLYCSFVSHAIERTADLVPQYVEKLTEEIRETGRLAKELGLELQTVYMGGGTPTSLTPEQLEKILHTVAESFSLEHLLEYTVEAGRPDTVTREKLDVLRRYGVNRISINPQTMQDRVLDTIGRDHTTEQTLQAFALAKKVGFSAINMDLIAGLPGETGEEFLTGLSQSMELSPDNITIHTLTVKRSSYLRESMEQLETRQQLPALLKEAKSQLLAKGYAPYYLYRQKGTLENLENVGYTKPNKNSYYNIYSMEEVQTILAVGAGAATKLYARPNTIKRIYNHKYPYEYLDDFDEIMRRKSAVRSFYERNN